ncbi:hypothetical protein BKA93DRAFT_818126 [Sparassis latifolia]
MTQLEFEAHIVEYVNFVYEQVKSHGNSKGIATQCTVPRELPIYGPHFLPPTYTEAHQRSATPEVTPDTSYLKPVTVVHPFYYPELTQCPQCDSTDVKWTQWAATGHREVHGIFWEETAIGYQLRCKNCETQAGMHGHQGGGMYCFATTSHLFWERREHWEVPCEYRKWGA